MASSFERGDLFWLDFDPQAGREQAGRHPAMVISPRLYNQRSNLLLVCPITSAVKGYPFEVVLPASGEIRGVVLTDQIRAVDPHARRATLAGTAPAPAMVEVLAKIASLLQV